MYVALLHMPSVTTTFRVLGMLLVNLTLTLHLVHARCAGITANVLRLTVFPTVSIYASVLGYCVFMLLIFVVTAANDVAECCAGAAAGALASTGAAMCHCWCCGPPPPPPPPLLTENDPFLLVVTVRSDGEAFVMLSNLGLKGTLNPKP